MAFSPSTFWLAVFLLILYPCSAIWKAILYRLAMSKAGCSVPIKYKHKDPVWGLDFFLKRVKAMQSGDTLAVDRDLFDTYGKTVQTNSWGTKRYMTSDSQNMQNVLALQVDCFGVEPLNRPVGLPFLGDGILTNDGALWKRSRSLLNPIFARAQVSQLSTFETQVNQMISLIPRDNSTVDLQPLFKMLFLDSSTEFIFGRSANSLLPETTSVVARRLPEVFDNALRAMQKRFMMGNKISYLTGNKTEFLRMSAETHAIIDNLIDEEIELQQSKAGKSSTMTEDSTYSYVLLKELVKNTHDKRFIRDQLMNVFFPGRDTAAILTGNVIFFLARRPKVWDKLRSEVSAIGSQTLTFELLKSMKYLQGVINETLRIQNPVQRSWKTCISSCVLPHGGGPLGQDPILLQKGDEVEMVMSVMHIDQDLWGEDVMEFKPERWHSLKQSWNFIPFLGGRRTCPAQQNVLTEVGYVVTRLVQEFRTCENRDPCFEYVEEQIFTKQSRNGVQVAFVPA